MSTRLLSITGISLLFFAFGMQGSIAFAQESTDVVLQNGYQTSATPAQGEMNRFHAILQNNTGRHRTVDVALELRDAQSASLAHVRHDGVGIDPFNIAVRTLDSPVNLTPGTYTWQVRIFHPGTENLIIGYENALQFTVRGDDGTTPPPEGEHRCGRPGTNNFNVCYYDNIDFTEFRVNRTDPAIDFNWGQGSPDPSIAPDTFSARWLGLFEFEEGVYEFTVTTDDGFRLNVDNEWILDEFHDQPATTYTVRKHMPAGQRGVIAEYYENTGDAVAMLSWEKVSDEEPSDTCEAFGTGAFNACYFQGTAFETFKIQRTDPAIDFDWGGGSPDPSIEGDRFSAQWRGMFDFEEGEYEFSVTTDDGFRLYVDDELVIDAWIDQPPTTHTATHTMRAGQHEIYAEYYERSGGAVAMLDWQKADENGEGEGDEANCGRVPNGRFNGCYYDTMDFTDFRVQRLDEVIDFDWGQGSPHPSVGTNTFSARWWGAFDFEEDAYEFSVTTDDGFRLYIDDELVIDAWVDQPATTHTAQRTMTEGQSTIRAEYYENGGDAVAMLSWEKASE